MRRSKLTCSSNVTLHMLIVLIVPSPMPNNNNS
jgi:hypothetical protein